MKSVAFTGALSVLQTVIDFRSELRYQSGTYSFCGTSAGSLVAALCYMRADFQSTLTMQLIEEVVSLCTVFDQLPFFGKHKAMSLHTGRSILELFRRVIKQFTGLDNPTFLELSNKVGKLDELVVCATNVSTSQATYFSAQLTPNVLVIRALMASMCLPFLFEPVIIDGKSYVDGGLSDNCPFAFDVLRRIQQSASQSKSSSDSDGFRCLNFSFADEPEKNTISVSDIFSTVVSGSTNFHKYQLQMVQVLNNIAGCFKFNVSSIVFLCGCSSFSFTKCNVNALLNDGEITAKDFVANQ